MSVIIDGTAGITNTGAEVVTGNVTAASFIGSGASLTGIAGGFSNMQVFTSPGTFTTPSSTTKIKVTVVGGGGGGSVPTTPGALRATGSGGGGAAIYVGPVTASTPYAVTVGAGGVAGTTGNAGGTGNTSSFAALASATGGAGGPVTTAASAFGGAGGAGSAGTLQITGDSGFASQPTLNGIGGGSILAGIANSTASQYGGGAGANGGAGGVGVVIVEY
jgi:hypothetical protein